MEAKAKGSPTMLPALNLARLESVKFMLYGFFKEGECKEPYDGIRETKWSRWTRCSEVAVDLC